MRTISEATTRLPDPVKLTDDIIRYYQQHPIRGQLCFTLPRTRDALAAGFIALPTNER